MSTFKPFADSDNLDFTPSDVRLEVILTPSLVEEVFASPLKKLRRRLRHYWWHLLHDPWGFFFGRWNCKGTPLPQYVPEAFIEGLQIQFRDAKEKRG